MSAIVCNHNRAGFGLLYLFMRWNMKLSFYYVDEKYIQYLKGIELNKRGFTCIPNMSYHNHDKFVYGVVLSVNNVDYYVPFSHYDRQQEDNILIKVDYHKKTKVAGPLRFNYMFPVPKKCLIQKKALKTYNRVLIQMMDQE